MGIAFSILPKTAACAVALFLCAIAVGAQQPAAPLLTISSPANGTVLAPGEAAEVVVTAARSAHFMAVAVTATAPIPASEIRRRPPYEFTLTIPISATPGEYNLTALGRDRNGVTGSSPVVLRVERKDVPAALRFEPSRVQLEAFGEEIPVRVMAHFADGSDVDVTRSSHLSLRSENPDVAAAVSGGIIRAADPGVGAVVASYAGGPSARLQVATLPPVIRLSAKSLRFQAGLGGGESVAPVLTLTNTTDRPLEIAEITAGNDFPLSEDCTRAPLASGASCTVRVSFAPPGSQSSAGRLVISTRAIVGKTIVSLYGEAVAK